MRHHSISRWALGGLTATALSVSGLSAPAYAADTPTLIAGATQKFTAAPGDPFDVTLSVTNSGDTAVDGAVVSFDTVWSFEDQAQFSNCEYNEAGQVRACVFDQTLEPGASYRFVVPFRVRQDTYAPRTQDSFFQWLPAAGHTPAGTPGTGAALKLQEGDPLGESEDGDWQRATVTVTGTNGTDLVAIGGTASGGIGDTVEVEAGVRNDGPATLDFSRSGNPAGHVYIKIPTGTSIVSAPGCTNVTMARVLCFTDYVFKVGQVKTWKLTLHIDKRVEGAAGLVEVNPECQCDTFLGDIDKSNNTKPLTVDVAVDDEAPVIDRVDTVSQYLPNRVDTGTGWVGSLSHLQYTVTDKSAITRTEWWVNGALASTQPLFAFDAHTLTTPTAAVELRVWDAAGNPASKSFTVNIDKAVTGTTVLPAQNALIRGTSFVTTVAVNDPHGKAYSTIIAPFRVEGSRSAAKVTSGRDGAKTIIWEVSDRLGNVAQFKRTVIVDNTAPSVSLRSAPKNNAKLTKSFGFTVNASDKNGIGRADLLINGKKVATDTRAGWGFTIDPKKYGKSFTVQLRVYDKAGNSKLSTKRTYRR